jgi:hypothetical protein
MGSSTTTNSLTLGWQVTTNWDPRYWLDKGAKPGRQIDTDLVRVPTKTLANHTAIIAQSGSGKSFFLGRLIEEIMINTKARCIILDPNADFRRVHEVADADLWRKAKYDSHRRFGRLPHESSKQQFFQPWSKLSIIVKSATHSNDKHYEKLKLSWTSISVEFLAEDVEPTMRSGLYHCHSFTREIGYLIGLKNKRSDNKKLKLLDEAERLLKLARTPGQNFDKALSQEFDVKDLVKSTDEEVRKYSIYIVERAIERASTAASYVSDEVATFYFGIAREFQASGILNTDALTVTRNERCRLEVIDLPSLRDSRTRLLAMNSIISSEWSHARKTWSQALRKPIEEDIRVPTFIIIDEAHNAIPAEPRGKAEIALREQFRTIVAEGRKYGLFLILVSQRPDKIDPLVLSECDNKAIMKLSSGSVLDITRKLLGLDDVAPKLLEKCLEFEIGRGLLIGKWAAGSPQPFYCAARRTTEGGRNLRDDFWSVQKREDISSYARLVSALERRQKKSKKRLKRKKSR